MNYEELVKALRERQGLLCYGEGACPENCELLMNHGCYTKLHMDAAAAIEALQAEQKKTVTQIFGEEHMAWEGRCKDLMKYISDLQAET